MPKKITTRRVINSGLTNFFRNIWVSIAATSMVAITLFIISTIIILYTLTVLSINNSTDKVGVITAYFNDKTTEAEMRNISDEISHIPGVKSVNFTSKDEAKAIFLAAHKDEPFWVQSLTHFDANPVPASVSVSADNLEVYGSIYDTMRAERYSPYFHNDQGASTVRDNQKVIDKLHKIIDFISRFGVVLALIFTVVTIMVTFNTIRLTIYNRREEVEIMRLVGATNWYIRGPFIIEGVMYAVFATIFTSLVLFGLLYLLSPNIENFLSLESLGTSLINALFWRIFLINVLASTALTILASTIAIRKYLRI
ncbi:MAG: ABC transporter permease [Candidatus Doudnabacteria bacterium]|nr:ABC transporter permease [Candidatus Doudnabacteria bacterium]